MVRIIAAPMVRSSLRAVGAITLAVALAGGVLGACSSSSERVSKDQDKAITSKAKDLLNGYWGDLVASDESSAAELTEGPIKAQAVYRGVLRLADPTTRTRAGTISQVVVNGVEKGLGQNRYLLDATAKLTPPDGSDPLTYTDFVVEDEAGKLKLVDYTSVGGSSLAAQCVLGDGVPPATAGPYNARLSAAVWSADSGTRVGFAVVLGGTGLNGSTKPGTDATFKTTDGTHLTAPEVSWNPTVDGTRGFLVLGFTGVPLEDVQRGGTLAIPFSGQTLNLSIPPLGR
jgi:hypothetical protein